MYKQKTIFHCSPSGYLYLVSLTSWVHWLPKDTNITLTEESEKQADDKVIRAFSMLIYIFCIQASKFGHFDFAVYATFFGGFTHILVQFIFVYTITVCMCA